jgi:heterodisulfide reductase subunit D
MMAIFGKLFSGNILYYPGCLTKTVAKDLLENYKKILTKIGIDYIVLNDLEVCCGSPILNAGFKEDARKLAEKNFEVFKAHGVKKIITACPACYKTYSQDYPKLLKKWDIEVEHITMTLSKAIKEGKLKPKQIGKSMTYHDPCHLGRHCGIYDEPREFLKATGAELKEMELSKELAFCCGAGGGVSANHPELAAAIAKERVSMAEKTGADELVTCCPMCYYNLKDNSKKMKVREFSQLLVEENEQPKR